MKAKIISYKKKILFIVNVDWFFISHRLPIAIAAKEIGLEVHIATGSSIMDFQKKQPFSEARYPFLAIATKWERKILYERINQRTHKMLESGWIEEVINLIKNFPKNSKPFQSIGYREIIQYLTGELKYHQMVTLIQRRTRRYAKRQMTWFRKESTIEWIEPKDFSLAKSKTKVFLEK